MRPRRGVNSQFIIRYPEQLAIISSTDDFVATADADFLTWNPNTAYYGVYHTLACRPMLATYEVTITFNQSKRHISYRTRDMQDFIPQLEHTSENPSRMIDPRELMDIPADLDKALQLWEMWAVLDGSLELLDYNCTFGSFGDLRDVGFTEIQLANGTKVGASGAIRGLSSTRSDILSSNPRYTGSLYYAIVES